jgi:ATP synthase protein I
MTRSRTTTRQNGVRVLLTGAAATVSLGLVAAVVSWLLAGSAAGLGALVGVTLIVVVATGGTLMVNAVAGVMPTASLLVALLTYTLQLLVLLLAFVWLERSGLLADTLDRGWLGGAVVGGTVLWLATLVRLTFRARIPTYDLSEGVRGR